MSVQDWTWQEIDKHVRSVYDHHGLPYPFKGDLDFFAAKVIQKALMIESRLKGQLDEIDYQKYLGEWIAEIEELLTTHYEGPLDDETEVVESVRREFSRIADWVVNSVPDPDAPARPPRLPRPGWRPLKFRKS